MLVLSLAKSWSEQGGERARASVQISRSRFSLVVLFLLPKVRQNREEKGHSLTGISAEDRPFEIFTGSTFHGPKVGKNREDEVLEHQHRYGGPLRISMRSTQEPHSFHTFNCDNCYSTDLNLGYYYLERFFCGRHPSDF